ncbi:MAG: hypothetical protein ABI763_02970 [Bacteroidota bacterium]
MTHHKSTDRNTILLVIGSGIGQIGSHIEWTYFSDSNFFGMSIIGTALLIGGILFRHYAIHILRKYFFAAVAHVENKSKPTIHTLRLQLEEEKRMTHEWVALRFICRRPIKTCHKLSGVKL